MTMECPFLCGYHTSNDDQAEYHITAHIELHHTPESQFAAEEEDLKFALALQREEEEQISADAKYHDTSIDWTAEDLDPQRERAANNAVDDDFPYAECHECEDFVHLIELDEHMNKHLSLQYSSNTITDDMAKSDSKFSTNLGRSSTVTGRSTTIARPMDQTTQRSSGIANTAASARNKPQGSRLGVSLLLSSLVSTESP
jgi:hypothetical protein